MKKKLEIDIDTAENGPFKVVPCLYCKSNDAQGQWKVGRHPNSTRQGEKGDHSKNSSITLRYQDVQVACRGVKRVRIVRCRGGNTKVRRRTFVYKETQPQ